MPAWLDRVKESITLTSPTGLVFTAKWRKTSVRVNSKSSIRPIPDLDGDVVQAQGTGSRLFDIAAIFNGENNDINARNFQATLIAEQKQKWTVNHPVEGILKLLWIQDSIREVDPTGSGNVTIVSGIWIESLEETKIESAAQLQDNVEKQAAQANEAAAAQAEENAVIDEPIEKQSFLDSVSSLITSVGSTLSLIENFQIIDPQILAIIDAIEKVISGEAALDTTLLSGQVQQMVQKFGFGQSNAIDGIKMYSDFSTSALETKPTQATQSGKSQIAGTELGVSAALVAAAQVSLIGGFSTRAEVLTAIDALNLMFEEIRDGLDDIQTLYADNPIDLIYWSQSSAYADMQKMISDAIRFLENSLLSLPSERTAILEKATAPAQVCKDEYGTVTTDGETLDNLDFFIKTNPDIMGDLLYLLPADYEAKIYQ